MVELLNLRNSSTTKGWPEVYPCSLLLTMTSLISFRNLSGAYKVYNGYTEMHASSVMH